MKIPISCVATSILLSKELHLYVCYLIDECFFPNDVKTSQKLMLGQISFLYTTIDMVVYVG